MSGDTIRGGGTRVRSASAERLGRFIVPYEKRLDADLEWALSEGGRFFEGKSSVHLSLRKITQRLDELGIPYAVAGGMALYYHGFRRFTEDVDILVTRESRKEIQRRLTGLGFVPPFERSKNLRDTETGVKIEFLSTGDYPGDGKEKPVAFPDPKEVGVEKEGIRVLRLETLIELKLASGMSSTERGKDLVDAQELIKLLTLSEDFASSLNPYVRDQYLQLWRNVFGQRRRYMTLWRDKRLTADAGTIDEMIGALRAAADRLQAMKDDGIVLEPAGGASDDYVYLTTYDPAVAKKWGLEDEREFESEDETAGEE